MFCSCQGDVHAYDRAYHLQGPSTSISTAYENTIKQTRLTGQVLFVAGKCMSKETQKTTTVLRSCSVHKRHIFGAMGDTSNLRVRMSNLLCRNMACFLKHLMEYRRCWFIIEQPTSSWLFKMNFMLAMAAVTCCVKIHTWFLGLTKVIQSQNVGE